MNQENYNQQAVEQLKNIAQSLERTATALSVMKVTLIAAIIALLMVIFKNFM